MTLPVVDCGSGIVNAGEPVQVETVGAHLAIEAFNERVLRWLSWLMVSKTAIPIGIGIDAVGVMVGQVSYAQAGTNIGFAAYGYYFNPFFGAAYFAVDLFYPGGWPQALRDRQAIVAEGRAFGFPVRTGGWGE